MNVISPWLTHAMLPRSKRWCRVVNLSAGDNASGAPVPIDVDNLQAEKGFKGLTMAHSKSVMEAMSCALAKRLASEGITVNVVFPGRASTAMTRSVSLKGLPGPMKLFLPCMKLMFMDDGGHGASRAAKSTVFACTSHELDGLTGRYFDSACKERKMHPKAVDPEVQARILTAIEAAEGAGGGRY